MTSRRLVAVAIVVGALASGALPAGPAATPGTPGALRLTHGIASGDPTASAVVIWARANRTARMHVQYVPATAGSGPPLERMGPTVGPATDFTGKVTLDQLAADTRYRYWVRFTTADGEAEARSETGQFRTMPRDDATRALTLVWWGDLGGQGYCRDPEQGYALFVQMARVAPDLAIANGDSVYADGTCPPVTRLPDHPSNALSPDPEVAAHQLVAASDPRWTAPAAVLSAYRAKWKYNLEDPAYRRFRAAAAHVYQWDDHEVVNDWSPGEPSVGGLRGVDDARPMTTLSVAGRQAFLDFTPTSPGPATRIDRSVRLGRLAELFLLDTRSYRDDNTVPDRPGLVFDVRLRNGERRRLEGRQKSLLGAEQRAWLLRGLAEAQARGAVWKIVASDQSLALPSGSYPLFTPEGPMRALYHVRDGWAAGNRLNADTDGNQASPFGAESELRTILRFVKVNGIRNVIWLATDVHHARFFRFEPGGELAGSVFHEFTAGPAAARSAPARWSVSSTFRPIELYARGRRPAPARPSFLNFGVVRIATDGTLTVEIRDIDGRVPPDDDGRPGTLRLVPEP